MTSCLNSGSSASGSTTCTCPPGVGDSTCSSLSCGNANLSPGQRPLLDSNATSTACASQCSSGWTGLNCNVCTSAQSCNIDLPASEAQASTSASSLTSTSNQTIICSDSAYTYAQSFTNCDVINPTLQAVYPGSTTLIIQRTANASYALSSQFGGDGTLLAQVWYSPNSTAAPIEQFYCSASSCTQRNQTSYISYTCSALSCSCITTSTFCGGPGSVINIDSTVDGLTGPLEVDCQTSGNGQCSFKQSVLDGLFGSSGLGLSGCRSGECIRQGLIDAVASSNAPKPSDSLSGGVIAGLAVLGAAILLAAVLLFFGKLRQRKARRGALYDTSSLLRPPLVGMQWQAISYSLPSWHHNRFAQAWAMRRRPQSIGKVILSEVSGAVPAGSMLAILGPSGAGKSTLIDILAGRRKVGRTTGAVGLLDVNGRQIDIPARIAYVDQEDVLPATSTVREALMFAAELKLPESITTAEKRSRVEDVLQQLRLGAVADSRIGSGERRGISGGERRRLSIGIELMSRPSILLLDEPTSGLDAVSAMRVVDVLRELASGSSELKSNSCRTTVIACIHQPSSQIIYGFDLVSVLAFGGRQIYFGSVAQAGQHFADRGQPCPSGFNIADHLLELASYDMLDGQGSSVDSALRDEKLDSSESIRVPSAIRRRNTGPITTAMTQFEVVALRQFRELRRDFGLFGAQIAAAVAVGLFTGGMYWQQTSTISSFQNRVGSLFLLSSLIAFWSMSALANLAEHKRLFLRERASGTFSPWVWLLSRAIFDMVPLRIIPTLIVSTIVYWMSGLYPGAAEFFKYLLVLVEFAIAEALFNLLLAASIPNFGVAILLSALLILFQMALAGFFVSVDSIPGCLKWLHYLDPLRYALEALTVNEVNTGLQIQDSIGGVPVSISAETIANLLFAFDFTAFYTDVLVLFAWIAGFAILLVLAVQYLLLEVR